jgi:hypothetical protein
MYGTGGWASGWLPPPLLPEALEMSGDSAVVALEPSGESVPPQAATTIAEDNPTSKVVTEARMMRVLSEGWRRGS